MSTNTYYLEELSFLRDMGREFAQRYPAVAHMLETAGADPDVERLLEGIAFLTGRVRQKLDDELPELYQSMMALLWPHYLRPIPSTGILQFEPIIDQLSGLTTIERGTEVESTPVRDGNAATACRFRTCYDVELSPLRVESAEIEMPMATDARFKAHLRLSGKAPMEQLGLKKLRFFLADELTQALGLYLWLLRYGRHVELHNPVDKRSVTLPITNIRPGGFGEKDNILPYPDHCFVGYRLLQEYFTCPAKFYFIEFQGLEALTRIGVTDRFEIIVPFSRRPEDTLRATKNSIRLNCTPIVNLFPSAADGIRVDHSRTKYRVRPATAGAPPEHFEVYAVEKVIGLVQGEAERRVYQPLHSFRHSLDAAGGGIYFQTTLYDAVVGDGTDTFISFVSADERHVVPPTETISIDLMVSNRNLASALKVGEVSVPTAGSPEFARFRNITPIARSLRPPLGKGLHWRLISHLSLNYLSLMSVEALRGILELYNYQALYDRQAARENVLRLEGIASLEARPAERLIRGAPVRGTSISLQMTEDNFAGEGDMYLFATVLNEFFALYASMNSFTQLKLRGTKFGEVYQWPPRLGQQIIL